jgi:ATP-binding cassette subfamily F protein 3
MDEPTNHLDLATREALAVALNEFEGTLMLVSHDRALLRSVCDEFWLVGRGVVTDFDGDLDDYQRYLLDEAKRQREQLALANASNTIAASVQPESTGGQKGSEPVLSAGEQRRLDAHRRQQLNEKMRPIKRALADAEKRMEALGAERAALEVRLSTPLDPADIADAGRRLKAVSDELAQTEEHWLTLSDELQTLEQTAS